MHGETTTKYRINLGTIDRKADLSAGRGAEERMLVFLAGLKEDYHFLKKGQVEITHQVGTKEEPKYETVTNLAQFLELAVNGAKLDLEGAALLFHTGSYQLIGTERAQGWDQGIDGRCNSCLDHTPDLANLAPGVNDYCLPDNGKFCSNYRATNQNQVGEKARPFTELVKEVVR